MRKGHRTDAPFQQIKTETQESSEIYDARSIFAMFLTVLYEVEGLETKAVK